MRKLILMSMVSILWTGAVIHAQKYFTKTGTVRFVSTSTLEKIEAETKTANCVLDIKTGAMEMAILIKSFNFDKALMQEHFNEDYMESDKFPKATVKGTITNISDSLASGVKYEGKFKGTITIHGESKPIESKITYSLISGSILASTELKISLADFKIEIPAVVKDNIGKTVDIFINTKLELFKKPQ
ncbi:MAG: YceI family protein [Saprospiraceae bacterium]